MKKQKVLIFINDLPSRQILKKVLETKFESVEALTLKDAIAHINAYTFQFCFLDVQALSVDKQGDGYSLQDIWDAQPNMEIIALAHPTNQATSDAVKFVQKGAYSYLTLPLIESEVELLLQDFFEQEKLVGELKYLRERMSEPGQFITTQTYSPKMKKLYQQVQRVAETNSNIYISGETGTGKSLLAKLIHQNSTRKKHSFISIHCGAIPESLIESELFGYEKGAFTSAQTSKQGKFELANKGTIFLDEVGTMPFSAQVKLLQIIQERKNIRVGGIEEQNIDVRVISASNEDLQQLCEAGHFRKDLYYRLNVFPLELPPLRERKEDIPLLVATFINKLNQLHGKSIKGISPRAMDVLLKYHWPGNIRELENVLERAFILESSDILQPSNFPSEFEIINHIEGVSSIDPKLTLKEIRIIESNRVEKLYLNTLLADYKGRIEPTAKAAGISTRQLHKLLTKHFIRKEEFKTN